MTDIPPPASDKSFPIVGIGASTGGLEAFTQLLTHLPAQSGMAFVLIQHLEPKHDNHLAGILSKITAMPVEEAKDGMAVVPNHVYVIPPNANMALENGVLRLTARVESHGAHLSIDFFLSSLAQDMQRQAIGVVLSGTGSDGTLGLGEIKAAGGITFAQDEESAMAFAMPGNAIAADVVDIILPPQEIARELARIVGHPYLGIPDTGEGDPTFAASGGEGLSRIISLLSASSGIDFTQYRDSTIKRRILRRMALGKKDALSDYVRHLEEDGTELKALYQDILIHVTRFFRDPRTFDALVEAVLPTIRNAKAPGEAIRVWVAGCATGEEAYSLAMVISEFQDGRKDRCELSIFASDICESPSLERARAGLYPENIEHDVSPERLCRFFVKEESGYRISKEIRAMCVFARHDVTADPPFAKLDFISCRNVLIYISVPMQRRILPAFHYALNPGGFLLLGNSETIGKDDDLFAPVDAQLRIYSRKMTSIRLPNLVMKSRSGAAPRKAGPIRRAPTPLDFQQAADRLLLRQYAPPGVLVNKDMDVIQFRGRTSPFLEPPESGTGLNLAVMAQNGLSMIIREAIRECRENDAPVRKKDVRILDGRSVHRMNLAILPINLPDAAEACFLVLFENGRVPAPLPAAPQTRSLADPTMEDEVAMLRIGLAAAREYLQTIQEQSEALHEATNSSNEEMESSNEELQSTNEELETAKEELQSSNEELATMNEELRTRNSDLAQENEDLGRKLRQSRPMEAMEEPAG